MAEYIRLERENLADNPLLSQLVECYRQVFAEEPWNEWLKCPQCQYRLGINQVNGQLPVCPDCQIGLVEYWPAEQVEQDILHEVGSNDSWCWLVVDLSRLIGFCWGYTISVANLERKLGVSLAGLCERFKLDLNSEVAYQDELGILHEYRGTGLGRGLVINRLNDFLTNGLQIGVMRTQAEPPTVTYGWYLRKGYEVVARYPVGDNRVVMARCLDTFVP